MSQLAWLAINFAIPLQYQHSASEHSSLARNNNNCKASQPGKSFCTNLVMGNRGSSRNSEEITTRAGDKTRMKKIDKDIRKTFFFDKDLVAWKLSNWRKTSSRSAGEKWLGNGGNPGAVVQGDRRRGRCSHSSGALTPHSQVLSLLRSLSSWRPAWGWPSPSRWPSPSPSPSFPSPHFLRQCWRPNTCRWLNCFLFVTSAF